jgi:flagellar motor switch/type III secretory pathway protein FliN
MIIDQSEIDALLSAADGLATAAADGLSRREPPAPSSPRLFKLPRDPEVARILKVRVPVIVQLATRLMRIATVRDLSVGAIIEFEKSVEDPLDLMVSNRLIGQGTCVKAGEHFGLRVTQICDPVQRIRSLGDR